MLLLCHPIRDHYLQLISVILFAVIEGEHAAVIDDARVTAADARAVLADPRFQKQTYLLLYERVEEGMERPKKKLRSSRAASHVLVEPEVPVMRFEAREE